MEVFLAKSFVSETNLQIHHFNCCNGRLFAFMAMFAANPFLCLLLVIYSQHTEYDGYWQAKI